MLLWVVVQAESLSSSPTCPMGCSCETKGRWRCVGVDVKGKMALKFVTILPGYLDLSHAINLSQEDLKCMPWKGVRYVSILHTELSCQEFYVFKRECRLKVNYCLKIIILGQNS